MIPTKKKAIEQKAWGVISSAPRKSYLGKVRRISSIQSQWIRALLSVWGDIYGGRTDSQLRGGGGMWSCIVQEDWTDEQGARIAKTIRDLRKIGYRGDELLQKARGILWPGKSLGEMLEGAGANDDADFVEKAILAALKKDNPIYIVGVDYYANKKTVTEMGRLIQYYHAPWLSRIQAEDRVRWCIELFNSAVFFAIRDSNSAKNENTSIKA